MEITQLLPNTESVPEFSDDPVTQLRQLKIKTCVVWSNDYSTHPAPPFG
jgi:hypothetical protein